MKATIIGAGPAGLSTAILLRSMLGAEVRILEAAGRNEAPGFGIALLAFGINYLKMLELDRSPNSKRCACRSIASPMHSRRRPEQTI